MLLVFALNSCQTNQGWIELDWVFVDKSLKPVFPGGKKDNVCGLIGAEQAGESATISYDLGVRLNRYPCAESTNPEECLLRTRSTDLFKCDRARGTVEQTSSGSDGYLIEVQVIAKPKQGSPFIVRPSCIAVPGPRYRKVQGGTITDLAVYQIVLHRGLDKDMIFSECREGFDN